MRGLPLPRADFRALLHPASPASEISCMLFGRTGRRVHGLGTRRKIENTSQTMGSGDLRVEIIAEHYERHENRCGVPSQVVELDHPRLPALKEESSRLIKL